MIDKIRDRLINNRVNVGVGDIKITESPNILATHLGSCVAFIIFDIKEKRGGLLHFLLPKNPNAGLTIEKYCDTGLQKLIEMFGGAEHVSSDRQRYHIFVLGGATMINGGAVDIAGMNISAVKQKIEELHFKPRHMDLGGTKGYEVLLDCLEGVLYYRRFGQEYKEVS